MGLDQQGPAHLGDEFGRGPAGPARRLDRPQGSDATLAVRAADPHDGVGAAPQVLGDRRDRVARVGLGDDQAVAKDAGGLGREADAIQLVPLLVRELDTPTHDNLPAAPPPRGTLSRVGRLNETICGPT